MELIKREQVPTDTGKKLYDLLLKAWGKPTPALGDFMYGTLMELKGDEKKQKLIDLIEKYDLDSDDICTASMNIADGIEPEIISE